MENNGLHGLDWSKIPRGLTKYLEMKETLTNADCSEVSDLENHSWLIALMYYDNENGHVGVYFPDTDEVHHVAPYGKTVIRPTTGTTFWKYNGN